MVKALEKSKPCGLRPRVGGVLATKIPNARKPSINPNSRFTPVCPWLPFCQCPNWQLANVLQCGTLHRNRVVPQVVFCQVVFQSVHGSYKKLHVLSSYVGLKPKCVICIQAIRKLASYVATLPWERWTRKILEHQRSTETRATCLHLGHNAGNILHPEGF